MCTPRARMGRYTHRAGPDGVQLARTPGRRRALESTHGCAGYSRARGRRLEYGAGARAPRPLRDHPHRQLDARPRAGAGRDRAARQRRDRRARDLHLPERGPRPADRAARGLGALRASQRPRLDGGGRGHRRLGAAERAAGLHPGEGARRPAHQVLPRARGGEVPVARVRAADRQGPARDRRDRAARRGPARVQPAGRGLPAARRLARGLRDRERAPLRAHAALAARARAALAARRAHRARRVGRRAALGDGRAGARAARRRVAARLPARAERRPAAHARRLARRARRARHRLAARAERRAAAHAGQRRARSPRCSRARSGARPRCARRSSRRSSRATR